MFAWHVHACKGLRLPAYRHLVAHLVAAQLLLLLLLLLVVCKRLAELWVPLCGQHRHQQHLGH